MTIDPSRGSDLLGRDRDRRAQDARGGLLRPQQRNVHHLGGARGLRLRHHRALPPLARGLMAGHNRRRLRRGRRRHYGSHARAARDWRLIWAMLALAGFGAAWSYLPAPVVPRQLMYGFQPSLFMLGIILAGLWLGRFFVVLGFVGIALIVVGYLTPEPWLRLWMAAVQSGTLILGGLWLGRSGVRQ